MGDAADALTDAGVEMLALHRAGRCGEVGPCQYCERPKRHNRGCNVGVMTTVPEQAGAVELALVQGDLSKLTSEQRLAYYKAVCESVGLNPLTRPFEYVTFQGKLTLYAKRDCTEQLRKIHRVSLRIVGRERDGETYVVTAQATTPDGRMDESTGAVALGSLKGNDLANAYMRCETKAKRRVTLSICGLGFLDESELHSVPDAKPFTEPEPPKNGHKALPAPADEPEPPNGDTITAAQLDELTGMAREYNVPLDFLAEQFNVSDLAELPSIHLFEAQRSIPNQNSPVRRELEKRRKADGEPHDGPTLLSWLRKADARMVSDQLGDKGEVLAEARRLLAFDSDNDLGVANADEVRKAVVGVRNFYSRRKDEARARAEAAAQEAAEAQAGGEE